MDEGKSSRFDIDAVLNEDLAMLARPGQPATMDDLNRIIQSTPLVTSGTQVRPLGTREYALRAPGMVEDVRVTTDTEYYEEHAESVELWSLGNPVF